MRVLACVVNWNTAAALPGVIESLCAQEGLDHVVVVDNGSADGSAEVVRRYPDVRLIGNADNRGFAGAANQGVALARELGADALLLCNPDIRLDPGHVLAAVAALGADPRRASVQGRLWRMAPGAPEPPVGQRRIDTTGHLAFRTRLFRNRGEGERDEGQYDAPAEVFGVSGALALYRLAALEDVAVRGEVFDEDLFAFWEDVDLDWRLRRRGWQAWYEPTATGWHERGGAGPRRSAFVEELNFANRFLVLAKHDDLGLLAHDLPGIAVTSLLKAGELALTEPGAFVRAWPRLWARWRRMRAKGELVSAAATVPNQQIISRWFAPFDYGRWVRTWWARVRARG